MCLADVSAMFSVHGVSQVQTQIALATLLGGWRDAQAERIKDIASLAAARPNQLMGYGLVVGLQGTGDGKDISFTIQSLREMLGRLGANVDGPLSSYDTAPTAVKDFKVENVAAVMVTAELPAFAKPGQKIDVNVAAIAQASSLRGGVLLMTRMRGPDGSPIPCSSPSSLPPSMRDA